jgi:D-aspartate ligase
LSVAESPPVYVLGGLENALSVARSLHARGVEVHAASSANSPVRYSRRRRSFQVVEGDVAAGWLEWLARADRPGLVFPCSDEALEMVAHHRGALANRGLTALEANDAAVLAMLDKDRTYEIARRAGIGAPRTRLLTDWEALPAAIEEIGFPAALKPTHIHEFRKHFREKVFRVSDETELRSAFAATHELGLSMILTEVIPGSEDRYCSYFTWIDPDGSFLFDFTKRKLRQYPVGFGGGTYHLTEWADDVADAGRRMLEAAGVRGLGNVEFKRDARDGALKLIECNIRFTAGNEIVLRAGVDVAWIAYSRMTGREIPAVGRGRDGVRMWYPLQDTLAFMESRRVGMLTLRSWLASLAHRQTFPIWSATDPLPTLARLPSIPGRAARKLRRRGSRVDPVMRTAS